MPDIAPPQTPTSNVTLWMPRRIAQACIDEAEEKFPLESGGTFMGWWADGATAVITAMIGPGPEAHHGSHSFQPDEAWQLEQIAHHYTQSGRRETYLGDWHSHPEARSGNLSWTDRRVLRRVITTPSARCAEPLMVVFWGHVDEWQVSAWRARLQPRTIIWDRLVLEQAEMKYSA